MGLIESINQANSDFNNIKSAIVESGVDVPDGTPIYEYSKKVGKVYEAGQKAGVEEHNRIVTDAMTSFGTRENYGYAFANGNWTGFEFSETIKPKAHIHYMFYNCVNMTELPKPLDFSEILLNASDTYAYRRSVFGYCRNLKVFPDVNMRAIGGIEEWFAYCNDLHTIELLRVKAETVYNANTFIRCDELVNLTIDGVIGQEGFNVKDSKKLSKASITSIISALSTETTGLTVTISKTAKEAAFTDDEWSVLEATKPNWTIALA